MPFFMVPNLQAQSATSVVPWEFKSQVPKEALGSKKDYVDWSIKASTRHCFYSAYEGVMSSIRVTEANPPHLLHGFVADYDNHNITTEQIRSNVANPPCEWLPAYGGRTFSGGARLVWLFERPIRVPGTLLLNTFLKSVVRKLKLRVFLPGFDEDDAFLKPSQYYDVGTEWMPLSPDYRITYTSLSHWMYEAGGKIDWSDKLCRIPVSELSAEVERKFPGKWPGAFEIGAMGPRFWDPVADNMRGCIVRESGMQCFTGDEWFMSWLAVFGPQFVERFKEKQVAAVVADTFYDGREFWWTDMDGLWQPWSKDDFKVKLRVQHKLRGGTGAAKAQDPGSEIDKVMAHVHQFNRVEAALPFVHMPSGLLKFDRRKYLNTADIKCMEPSDQVPQFWGDGFPWFAGFMDNFFRPKSQLDYFLSWWHYFYKNALRQTPQPGHALFFVGDPGVGKTLLSTRIVSATVGGHADASSFLLGDERFTASTLRFPVMTVDDTVPATDSLRHNRYSSMVKKIVANRWHGYEQKFQKAGKVLWHGRIIVTCNADPESIRLLPNMDISIRDKVCLFRCRDQLTDFPSGPDLDQILDPELPRFCRWLLDYEPPAHCRGGSRFYTTPYHHPTLYQHALQSSISYSFFELLQTFLHVYREATHKTHWEGNSTSLLVAMLADEGLRPIAQKFQPNQIAIYLGQLKSRGYGLIKGRDKRNRWWIVPTGIQPPELEGGDDDEDEVDREPTEGSAKDIAGE